MTDVAVEQDTPEDFIAKVVLKGGAGEIEVNFTALSDDVAKAVVMAGLDTIFGKANGAAKVISGVTKLEGKELADRQAEIRKAAEATHQQLKDGVVPGAKKVKASGAVNTEAMRIAKNMVKDLIRSEGQKIGAYSAKELTAAAKEVLARNQHIIQLAEKNLAERAAEAKGSKSLDLKGLFGAKAESDEVKAKPKVAPKRKDKGDKAPLSAKQAGLAAPRTKPAPHATH